MLHRLRRHPFAVEAHFDFAVALTYAIAASSELELPAPLVPDLVETHAFLAIALVQTRRLRPAGFPQWTGQDFFLAGYRIFCRPAGSARRGLRILASYTDSPRMCLAGNLFTHYNYLPCEVEQRLERTDFRVRLATSDGGGDLDLTADLRPAAAPPSGSLFADLKAARRFAGPMPYTFNVEAETGSIVSVRGVRSHWKPRPVNVEVRQAAFLRRFPGARLAGAWYVSSVDYRWERGEMLCAA